MDPNFTQSQHFHDTLCLRVFGRDVLVRARMLILKHLQVSRYLCLQTNTLNDASPCFSHEMFLLFSKQKRQFTFWRIWSFSSPVYLIPSVFLGVFCQKLLEGNPGLTLKIVVPLWEGGQDPYFLISIP